MVVLQHAAARDGEERLQMSSVLLENVVIMGLVCLWLCVSGKSTRIEHPVWEPGSIVCRLAGRLVRAGAHLSPFLNKFLKAALWQDRCLCGKTAFLEAEVFLRALAFPPFSQRANC